MAKTECYIATAIVFKGSFAAIWTVLAKKNCKMASPEGTNRTQKPKGLVLTVS